MGRNIFGLVNFKCTGSPIAFQNILTAYSVGLKPILPCIANRGLKAVAIDFEIYSLLVTSRIYSNLDIVTP